MTIQVGGRDYQLRPLKTRDVFTLSRILKRMKLEIGGIKAQTQEQAGMEVMYALLTHFGDAETEMCDWLGSLIGMPGPEFAELELGDTMKVLAALKSSPGIMAFFEQVGRSIQ